jgi:hypothetical protein
MSSKYFIWIAHVPKFWDFLSIFSALNELTGVSLELFCTEKCILDFFNRKTYPTRWGRARGPDPTRSGPATDPAEAHPAGRMAKVRGQYTAPPSPLLGVRAKGAPGPAPIKATTSFPVNPSPSHSPPPLFEFPPPRLIPGRVSNTRSFARLSRAYPACSLDLWTAGAPPPVVNSSRPLLRIPRRFRPSPCVFDLGEHIIEFSSIYSSYFPIYSSP